MWRRARDDILHVSDASKPPPPYRARLGALAEAAAAEHVQRLGMQVLARNCRAGRLELDIVARDGDTIVVVEVRLRGRRAWQRAFHSVQGHKQRKLQRAAQILWLRVWRRMRGIHRVRFDVASVSLGSRGPRVEYVKAAFFAGRSYADG